MVARWTPNPKVRVQILYGLPINGGVAHLGERIPCTDKVAGSIPVASTNREVVQSGRTRALGA